MASSKTYDYNHCPTANDNFNSQKLPAVSDGYPPLPPLPAYIPVTEDCVDGLTNASNHLHDHHYQSQYQHPDATTNTHQQTPATPPTDCRAILLICLAKAAKHLFLIVLIAAILTIMVVLPKLDSKKCPRGYDYLYSFHRPSSRKDDSAGSRQSGGDNQLITFTYRAYQAASSIRRLSSRQTNNKQQHPNKPPTTTTAAFPPIFPSPNPSNHSPPSRANTHKQRRNAAKLGRMDYTPKIFTKIGLVLASAVAWAIIAAFGDSEYWESLAAAPRAKRKTTQDPSINDKTSRSQPFPPSTARAINRKAPSISAPLSMKTIRSISTQTNIKIQTSLPPSKFLQT
ncbi:hypothetical protein Q7P35_006721 [Cladosporium inversicolor]